MCVQIQDDIYSFYENSGKNHEVPFITLEINSEFVTICESVITFIFQKRNRFTLFLRND